MAENRAACLVKIKTDTNVRNHLILRGQFVIGRSTVADLPLLDISVSRQHLKVELRPEGIALTDLSSNGVTVDGKKIPAGVQTVITPSSCVRLGASNSEYYFLPVEPPMEAISPDEQKQILLASMGDIEAENKRVREKIIEEERQKAAAFLKREEENIRQKAEQSIRETNNKINQDLTEARFKAEQTISAARQQAEAVGAQTLVEYEVKRDKLRAEADTILAEARELALKNEQAAFAAIEKHRLESRDEGLKELAANKQKAEAILAAANQKAEATLSAATQKAEAVLASSTQKAEALLASTKEKTEASLLEAEQKCAKKIEVAEVERTRIIEKAKDDAQKSIQEATFKSKVIIDEAKKRSDNVALDSLKRAELEIEESKRAAVDATRLATFAEQEKILKEYRGRIEKLQDQRLGLEAEVTDFETKLEGMLQDRSRIRTEVQLLEKHETERRLALSQIEDELSRAQKIIQSVTDIEIKRDEAKREMLTAREQAENFRAEYDRQVKSVKDDLQNQKEQVVLEYQAFRKRQEDDLNKERLAALEKLKQTIEEEEARYMRTLKLRASEIATTVTNNLIPQLEADLQAQGVKASLSHLLDIIQSSVNEVIVKEPAGSKAETKHLGVDPKAQAEKLKKMKGMAWVATAVVVVALAVFGSPLFNYLKQIQADHSEQREITLKRNAESIYTPVQNDDWHESYTGNVLYMRFYYEAKTDPVYQEQWLLRLNNLEMLRSLHLSEDDIVQFLGKERALISQLGELRQTLDAKYLDQGLEKMNQAESAVAEEMKKILKTDENVIAVSKIEKDFVTQFIKVRFGAERLSEKNANKTREPSQEK